MWPMAAALEQAAKLLLQGAGDAPAAGTWGQVTSAVKGLLAKVGQGPDGPDQPVQDSRPARQASVQYPDATSGRRLDASSLHAAFSMPITSRSGLLII